MPSKVFTKITCSRCKAVAEVENDVGLYLPNAWSTVDFSVRTGNRADRTMLGWETVRDRRMDLCPGCTTVIETVLDAAAM